MGGVRTVVPRESPGSLHKVQHSASTIVLNTGIVCQKKGPPPVPSSTPAWGETHTVYNRRLVRLPNVAERKKEEKSS